MDAKQFLLHSKLMAEMYPASLLSINMRAICYTGNILHVQMFKIFNQRTHNTFPLQYYEPTIKIL